MGWAAFLSPLEIVRCGAQSSFCLSAVFLLENESCVGFRSLVFSGAVREAISFVRISVWTNFFRDLVVLCCSLVCSAPFPSQHASMIDGAIGG